MILRVSSVKSIKSRAFSNLMESLNFKQDCLTVVLLVLMLMASTHCDVGKKSDVQSVKSKRDASIGTFSYVASDISKHDGSHVKTLTLLKNIEIPSVTDAFSAFSMLRAPQKKSEGKTTVEFWPPDMDKEKFYNMKKDSAMEFWPVDKQEYQMHIISHKQPLSEKVPDIPIDKTSWAPADITDYHALISATEGSIIDAVSITDPGPVVFPTLEPTTKGPDQTVVFITRTGHKKRKLKKKVKLAPTMPFVETSEPFVPYSNTVIETTSNRNIAEATPIYEDVDESYINNYQPIRYTDVVSNLTDLSFGERTVNKSNSNNNNSIETLSISFGNYNPLDIINVSKATNDGMNSDTSSSSHDRPSKDSFPKIYELMPLDRQLNQLKQAIEERDIAKIKNIVQMMEEPKLLNEKVTVQSTTEVAEINSSSKASTLLSTVTSTTVRNKVYLAPRVRNAQRKTHQNVTKSPPDEEQLNRESASTTEAEILTSSPTSSIISTTENAATEVAISDSTIPARRGRSYITSRVKNFTGRSRHAAKNIGRRFTTKSS